MPSENIRIDGPCVTETVQALETAVDPSERLSAADTVAAVALATEIVTKIVRTYEESVAGGEVGASGSGVAGNAAPSAGSCPTGLLYGKVQSGKTRAMIFTTAMCLDNGFRTVVVLTSDNIRLVEQTTNRFRAIDGPIVLHSSDRDQWENDIAHVRANLHAAGLVIVCAKNPHHQRALNDLLRNSNASDHPAIIFDDEADQATLDTTKAARAAGHASAPPLPSTMHRLTVENADPNDLGNSLRENLRHNVFVQVTATPFALLLQRVDDAIRPGFTHIVEPGDGYMGGDWYFTQEKVVAGDPPLAVVDANESRQALQASPDNPDSIPDGLRLALSTFCISAAARHVVDGNPAEPSVFLCHTSHRTDHHEHLESLIRSYLSFLLQGLSTDPMPENIADELRAAREELARTKVITNEEFDRCCDWVTRKLLARNVTTVNYRNGDFSYQRGLNFLVGGNILGRGLTIRNLLCTYYLREPRTSQMDTMLQHARMFGYSRHREDYLRVFLPRTLARRFAHIVETETELRDYLDRGDPNHPVPVRLVASLRATRPNVLDTSSISAYRPGQQVYPMDPEHDPQLVQHVHDRISRILQQQVFNGDIVERVFTDAPMAVVKDIVEAVALRDDSIGTWDAGGIKAVLDDLEPEHDGRAKVYVRRRVNTSRGAIYSGAASGDEIELARQQDAPILMLFEQQGTEERGWSGATFWFPTVVFPPSMDTRIFNVE